MTQLVETQLILIDGIPYNNEIKRIFVVDRFYFEIAHHIGQLRYWTINEDVPILSQDVIDIFIFYQHFVLVLGTSSRYHHFITQIFKQTFVSNHTRNLVIILKYILKNNEIKCLTFLRKRAPSPLPITLPECETHIKIYADIRHNLRELDINSEQIRKLCKTICGERPGRPAFFSFLKREIERKILWQEAMYNHSRFTSNQRWIVWSSSIVGLCCIPVMLSGVIVEINRPDHIAIAVSFVALAITIASGKIFSNQPSFSSRYLKCRRIAAFLYFQNGLIKHGRIIILLNDLEKEALYYEKEGEGEGEVVADNLLRALPYYPINSIDMPY
ncbi:uncharacterized protein NDAI_0J00390 [Naumovozyma dairenensis CBS 421]|uniref:Uncharacterized protein n=1 Tax=Naumovozyma dairenensis (strain ATCC 10597 / BCRC 20456 / CBS 421 / NBRC 0211 / NRRL Y-12639) TaxID=1071378 RepID=G0WGK3_NAUDC|nr:hypothetical protein NDAI_0J00390 [Naumovozyma dairenensis CBS 421]CCD26931.1 hypothetical protein NDAI_0J00390 [Naumovozyma dairenensis CBS 421]